MQTSNIGRYSIRKLITYKNKTYLVQYVYDLFNNAVVEVDYIINENGDAAHEVLMAAEIEEIIYKLNTDK